MNQTSTLLDVAADFGPFGGRTWINCAHQGPLPRVAAEAAREAVELKVNPSRLANSTLFGDVPEQLRAALARLISVRPEEIILGNSTSYGINLMANGIRWRAGDEVLLVKGDFPATIYPWLRLRERDVRITFITPRGPAVTAEEVAAHLTPATRVFCTTWVHSFTGYTVDETSIASVCREQDVIFVLNASQGLGHRPFCPVDCGIDVVTSCGFKWLCGPYGTGFCWIRPDLRDTLASVQAYWLANLSTEALRGDIPLAIRPDLGARAFDVFCTANFFNFMSWIRSVEYLLDVGIERIEAHDQALVSMFLQGIDPNRFEILSPLENPARSPLIVLRHREEGQTVRCHETLAQAGIDVALRGGALRVSPHVYNLEADIERALDGLASCSSG